MLAGSPACSCRLCHEGKAGLQLWRCSEALRTVPLSPTDVRGSVGPHHAPRTLQGLAHADKGHVARLGARGIRVPRAGLRLFLCHGEQG